MTAFAEGASVGESLLPLIGALRVRDRETQTTQAIAAIAAADTRFATGFVRLLVYVASRKPGDAGAHARAVPPPSGAVTCDPEFKLGSRAKSGGRIDLLFRFAGPPVATVGVEIKHAAAYQRKQVERYLRGLSDPEFGKTGLVVLTGRYHGPGANSVLQDHRWLGEVRWSDVADGLYELPFEPGHDALRAAWCSLLTTMRMDGELGIGGVDPERFAQWASGDRDVSPRNAIAVMDEIAETAQQVLEARTRQAGLRPRSVLATKTGHRTHLWRDREVYLEFKFTPNGAERLQLVLGRSNRADEDARARIEVLWFPRARQKHLHPQADGKRIGGYKYDSRDRVWYRESRLDPGATGSDLAAGVLRYWSTAVRALNRLDAFRGLS